ncbi:site-specific integrase [Deefgea piscis]|uniref:Site-specific integrase n=1 Tax=Deefgea piscis TaxID=2739061 RepID=A0A6M8SNQ7_9NEIS|nr:site-specific integrase [Deefgea piscis]QKJ66825.1 site-specific integrase [Deefgea piscis]
MLDGLIPDLTFPALKYGRLEIPLDLRALLYKSGAKINSRKVFGMIAAGQLGQPLHERLPLVMKIHEELTAKIVGGESKYSIITYLKCLKNFFTWAEDCVQGLSLELVEDTYRHWCDFLVNRQRLKQIKNVTAYHLGLIVSRILDLVLERTQPLIVSTRLRRKRRAVRAVGIAADKQNLADSFAFGHICLDVIKSLSFDAIFGPLPIKIQLRDGKTLEHWSKSRDPINVIALQPDYKAKSYAEKVRQDRANREADRTLRTRHPVANLRVVTELLVFIAQTGMNLAQAFSLLRDEFSYKSTIDGYEVRSYKARRKGEVLFEFYSEYKTLFQDYLVWRDKVFGDSSDRLFPLFRIHGALESTPPDFMEFKKKICIPSGVPFIGPQQLRKTRINWLLRQSLNPDLTAEQAQHTKATLLRDYEKPSLQVALVEIIQFWQENDPLLAGSPMPGPTMGVCDGVPTPFSDLPPEATKPDCSNPVGCLFCEHYRDIDSADYVWATASMLYFNTIILQHYRPMLKGKADTACHIELAIEVLTKKLKWYSDSNLHRKAWVEEANEKLAEGEFHAHWHYLIKSAEGI